MSKTKTIKQPTAECFVNMSKAFGSFKGQPIRIAYLSKRLFEELQLLTNQNYSFDWKYEDRDMYSAFTDYIITTHEPETLLDWAKSLGAHTSTKLV